MTMDKTLMCILLVICWGYAKGQSDAQCYACSFTSWGGVELGDRVCSEKDGPVDPSKIALVACPYQYCVKYKIDSDNYYHVSRTCLPACETLGDSNEYTYEGHAGRQYCCEGHLCNTAAALPFPTAILKLVVPALLMLNF